MIASIVPKGMLKSEVFFEWLTMNIWLEEDHTTVDFEMVFEIESGTLEGFVIVLNEQVKNLKSLKSGKGISLSQKHFLDERYARYFFGPSWRIVDRAKQIISVRDRELTVLSPRVTSRHFKENAVIDLSFDLASKEGRQLEKGRYGVAFYLIFGSLEDQIDETKYLFQTRVYDRQLISESVSEKLPIIFQDSVAIKDVHLYVVLPKGGDIVRAPGHTRYGHLEEGLNPWGLPVRLDIYWHFEKVKFPDRNFRVLVEYEAGDKKKKLPVDLISGFLVSLLASALIAYLGTSVNLGIISFLAGLLIVVIIIWAFRK
jgi:hypothetical protein